jgi:peptidoglycan/xylan/chitin deacetylase (PgdA/CDA1 family)
MRPLLSLLSPAGPQGRLSVLIFHRVLPAPDPLFPEEVDAVRFDAICGWLRRWFHVMPLPEAVRGLAEGGLPARAAAITFDDGYADNHDVALPILQRHELNATFFIATGFLDGGVMWNDQVIESIRLTVQPQLDLGACGLPGLGAMALSDAASRRRAIDAVLGAAKYLPLAERAAAVQRLVAASGVAVPRDLMLSTEQLQAMHAAGMTIGAHTVNHPILARLDRPAATHEIRLSKAGLEAMLQERIGLFAYPNGRPERDYGPDAVRAVREAGFDAAVTTAPGAAVPGSDLHQIPRFTPWDRSAWRFGARLGRNLRTPAQRVG